jgi:hypothetical protein
MQSAALAIHITAGGVGLVLGPVLAIAAKRPGPHTRLGDAYHWTFFVLFVSAVLLALLNWDEAWWLALVGVFSYQFVLRGWLAAKSRRPGWIASHVSGMGGSYIAMTTALLVVNWENLTGTSGLASAMPWFVPTLAGTPLIAYTIAEIAKGNRPKAWRERRATRGPEARSGSPSAA